MRLDSLKAIDDLLGRPLAGLDGSIHVASRYRRHFCASPVHPSLRPPQIVDLREYPRRQKADRRSSDSLILPSPPMHSCWLEEGLLLVDLCNFGDDGRLEVLPFLPVSIGCPSYEDD